MGFSYSNESTSIYNLILGNLIPQPVFSIWLGGGLNNGQLTLGGANSSYYTGSICNVFKVDNMCFNELFALLVYTPVVKKAFWEINLNQVIVAGKTFRPPTMTYKTAILDSASTYIVVPQSEMHWIAIQLNATRLASGHYQVDCNSRNSLPSISFYIENKPFALSSSDYVMTVADQVAHGFNSSKCILGLISGKVCHELSNR